MWHAFIFEAKSIQAYITAGGKLRHMVGASNLVHQLCAVDQNSALFKCLSLANLQVQFLRRAGGSFTFAIKGEQNEGEELAQKIEKFRILWSLHVQQQAPGLAFVDSYAKSERVSQAVKLAHEKMSGRRSFPAHRLPLATAPILRAQRTGAAAVEISRIDGEVLDECLYAKDLFNQNNSNAKDDLVSRFVKDSLATDWPRNMESEFPFLGEDKTIAIFHADGNRMGEIVQALGRALEGETDQQYIDTFLQFSTNIEQAIKDAASHASRAVLLKSGKQKRYPARPIICAGDDITIILRADIAIDFAQIFMQAFEEKCLTIVPDDIAGKTSLTIDGKSYPLPDLTICGGLIFAQANQPFLQVTALAESACKYAKEQAKRTAPERWMTVPSCLTIHRLGSSLIENYKTILKDELSTANHKELTANPYLVNDKDQADGLLSLSALRNLSQLIQSEKIGHGIWRQMVNLLYLSDSDARTSFRRLSERARKNNDVKQAWTAFHQQFLALLRTAAPQATTDDLYGAGKTPFVDALMIADIQRRSEAQKIAGEAA